MKFELRCEMEAPVPLGEVFEFFEEPRNLARITPPGLKFEVRAEGGIEMRKGAVIDYTIRWMGLPLKWRTLITEYRSPDLFVDEQIRGPYKLWRHHHEFQQTKSTSVITDRVEYELPMGILGRVAHALAVKRQLLHIFAYRQRAIAGILGVPGVRFTDPVIRRLPQV